MSITPVRSSRSRSRVLLTAICTAALLAAAPNARASAQGMGGGMGGMGGGGRGGRGGMGGRGGPGGQRPQSPADAIKANLEANDPLKFLLDRNKPLELTKAQKDTLERYRKDMHDAQKPVYKDLDQQIAELQKERGERGGDRGGERGGGMGPEGGMGGGMGGGAMGGGGRGGRGGRGQGGEQPDSAGEGRGRNGGPGGGPFRVFADKLADIQDSFRDRAWAQLSTSQRTKADSLQQVWLAEQRKKDEEKREKRGN